MPAPTPRPLLTTLRSNGGVTETIHELPGGRVEIIYSEPGYESEHYPLKSETVTTLCRWWRGEPLPTTERERDPATGQPRHVALKDGADILALDLLERHAWGLRQQAETVKQRFAEEGEPCAALSVALLAAIRAHETLELELMSRRLQLRTARLAAEAETQDQEEHDQA